MFLLYDKNARIHLEIITLVFVRLPFCSSLHLLLMIFIMFNPVDNKIILESIIINIIALKKREALKTSLKRTILLLRLLF